MINRLLIWQPVFIISVFLFGCTRSIEIPFPDPKPRIVVNGLFTSDSTWKIHISQSGSLEDTAFLFPPITNAKLNLYENDVYIGSPVHFSNGNYRLDSYPSIGKTYKLTVEAPGFSSVEAVDSLPGRVKNPGGFWNLETPVPLIDEYGTSYTSFLLNLGFEDISQERNFYHLSVFKRDSCTCFFPRSQTQLENTLMDQLSRLELDVDEPLSDPNSRKSGIALIQDISFKDSRKEINFYLDSMALFYILEVPASNSDSIDRNYFNTITYGQLPPTPESPRLFIKLYADFRSISETLYQYEVSYFRQSYGTADPFYEFGNVYSNIKNGLGIFAGYQRELIEIYSD